MTTNLSRLTKQILVQARHSLQAHHLTRIARCLRMLSEKEIWWRPHPTSNSVGNLVLHLEGNVRQWIISGLGGAPDHRERDKEFSARGLFPRRVLLARLGKTVAEASRVIQKLSPDDLTREYVIQGFRLSGLKALWHVVEHFAHHAGQIVLVTKMKRRRDLGFTQLPGQAIKASRTRKLHAI
jgi:uncharacterized damage-inducible protein DinB